MRRRKINRTAALAAAFITVLLIAGCLQSERTDNSGDDSLSKIKERGILIVGVCGQIEPMSYVDGSGKVVGFDVDALTEIAKGMGVKLELKEENFTDLFGDLDREESDLAMASITITPERSEQVLFSTPYYASGQVMVVRADEGSIKRGEDLKGRKVGVFKGTTCEKVALTYVQQSDILYYDPYEDSIPALKKGEIDAIIVDYVAAKRLLESQPDLRMVEASLNEEYYGIAAKKGHEKLMREVDSILRGMKSDGKLDAIRKRWV